jgi:hypothetical protein
VTRAKKKKKRGVTRSQENERSKVSTTRNMEKGRSWRNSKIIKHSSMYLGLPEPKNGDYNQATRLIRESTSDLKRLRKWVRAQVTKQQKFLTVASLLPALHTPSCHLHVASSVLIGQLSSGFSEVRFVYSIFFFFTVTFVPLPSSAPILTPFFNPDILLFALFWRLLSIMPLVLDSGSLEEQAAVFPFFFHSLA